MKELGLAIFGPKPTKVKVGPRRKAFTIYACHSAGGESDSVQLRRLFSAGLEGLSQESESFASISCLFVLRADVSVLQEHGATEPGVIAFPWFHYFVAWVAIYTPRAINRFKAQRRNFENPSEQLKIGPAVQRRSHYCHDHGCPMACILVSQCCPLLH